MTAERPRLKDLYWAYVRGETTFEELIRESEAQIAEREQREKRAREGGAPVA